MKRSQKKDAMFNKEMASKAYLKAYLRISKLCTSKFKNVKKIDNFFMMMQDPEIVYFLKVIVHSDAKVTVDNKLRWVRILQTCEDGIEQLELTELIYDRPLKTIK
ncbi:hypothetical protein HZS_7412 [Henneguya salminicola]|nr:hypothetical protein HZS_7412 [Henneguya salminicola]